MKLAKTIAMTALTSSALIMGGCATNGYNTGLNNTAKGAAAGAAAGVTVKVLDSFTPIV